MSSWIKREPNHRITNGINGHECQCYENKSGRWTCRECLKEERKRQDELWKAFCKKLDAEAIANS